MRIKNNLCNDAACVYADESRWRYALYREICNRHPRLAHRLSMASAKGISISPPTPRHHHRHQHIDPHVRFLESRPAHRISIFSLSIFWWRGDQARSATTARRYRCSYVMATAARRAKETEEPMAMSGRRARGVTRWRRARNQSAAVKHHNVGGVGGGVKAVARAPSARLAIRNGHM